MFCFNILTISNEHTKTPNTKCWLISQYPSIPLVAALLYKATAKRKQFSHFNSNRLFNKNGKQSVHWTLISQSNCWRSARISNIWFSFRSVWMNGVHSQYLVFANRDIITIDVVLILWWFLFVGCFTLSQLSMSVVCTILQNQNKNPPFKLNIEHTAAHVDEYFDFDCDIEFYFGSDAVVWLHWLLIEKVALDENRRKKRGGISINCLLSDIRIFFFPL